PRRTSMPSDRSAYPNARPPYRLELLPVVPPFYRRARNTSVHRGELVYYGPAPTFYGVGEVLGQTDDHVLVDFRGTGQLGVHEEALEPQYVLPIPEDRVGLI
ncbi:MAG: hypothetical protein AAGJ11_15235, partial [Bacteroidota bacterium]